MHLLSVQEGLLFLSHDKHRGFLSKEMIADLDCTNESNQESVVLVVDIHFNEEFIAFFFWEEQVFCLKILGFPRLAHVLVLKVFFAEGFVVFFWHEEGFLPKDIGFPSTVLNKSHELFFKEGLQSVGF